MLIEQTVSINDINGQIAKARRKSFGILAELNSRFKDAGIDQEDFWSLVREHFGIMRRRNLGDRWEEVAHILQCIKEDPLEWDLMLNAIDRQRSSIKF